MEKTFKEKLKELFPDAEILFSPLCINCESHPCECTEEELEEATDRESEIETDLEDQYRMESEYKNA